MDDLDLRAGASTNTEADPAELARALAQAGRYREAVDLLSATPAESLDMRTLCDLILWRNAAFDPEPGQADWPTRFADPFPGMVKPPEVRVADLNVEVLGGAIQHHGGLIVRGLINPDQTRQLQQVVRNAFAQANVEDRINVPESSEWYSRFPLTLGEHLSPIARGFGEVNGGIWTGDSPRAFADFVAFLKSHGVTRIIEEYLGERAFLSLGKSTLRIAKPVPINGWHQDGSFLGPEVRTVNVWLALSDCGEDAPGLDVYSRRLNGLVESGTKGANLHWTVGPGMVEELSRLAPVVTPVFKAGDAMLFDQLYLHQTGVRPWMTKERLAIESWFFAGSTFPMPQKPLAI